VHVYQVALQDLLLSQEHARNVIQIANNAVNKQIIVQPAIQVTN